MDKVFVALMIIFGSFLLSCTATKNYSPLTKFDRLALQEDYTLLKEILEHKHPSLYWYTPKDSMDMYFEKYSRAIRDSMTEQQFAWKILAPLVNKIKCGHTSVSFSKDYTKWMENKRIPSFPLFMKVWNDSMFVLYNLNLKDSIIKRGTLITSVNGLPVSTLSKKMFDYLPQDGDATSNNYIRMSANFPYYHRNIYGLSKTYTVDYIDSTGVAKTTSIPLYTPVIDSTKKNRADKKPRSVTPKVDRRLAYRSMTIDSSGTFAVMTVHTFSKGRLRQFFRESFKTLEEKEINNLVLDIRYNGGGRVGLSTLLTRYVSRKPFKVADSLYAVSKTLRPYSKYITGKFFNNIELFFIARKGKDGNYHIRHLEKKVIHPKKTNHYNGNLYVITAGPTFSAASLFCNAIKGQQGITLVGEETGGGWYGNNGIMIPDIILPNTKLRVRLPLFRLVQYNHIAEKGPGVIPDLYIGTSHDALIKGYDKKMQVVKDIILSDKTK